MELSPTPVSAVARRWQWLIIAVIAGWLIWLLAPVLTPFALAALLGWLGDPWVDRLQRAGRSRTTSVVLVFALMLLLILLALLILVPMIERQIMTLIDSWPRAQQWLMETAIPWLETRFGVGISEWLDPQRLIELARTHWQQAGGIAATFFGYLSRSGLTFILWVVNIVLVPILTFYFLRDWDLLVERIASVIPRDHIDTVSRLARESDEVLGAFIRGQFMVMLAQGAFYAVGMTAVGLKLGLLIGMIAGLISFVPYLGATIGLLLALIAALVQSGMDWTLLTLVVVVFAAGQLLESYVLTPRIVGDKIGLHPVAVIFAVMAGGQLFGFLGMLLALPGAAVVNVLLRYAHERYRQSGLYAGDRPAILLDSYVDKGVVEETPAPGSDNK